MSLYLCIEEVESSLQRSETQKDVRLKDKEQETVEFSRKIMKKRTSYHENISNSVNRSFTDTDGLSLAPIIDEENSKIVIDLCFFELDTRKDIKPSLRNEMVRLSQSSII